VLLGYTVYLSYGLVLGVLLPVVAVAVTRRWPDRVRLVRAERSRRGPTGGVAAVAFAVAGAAAVGVAFTVAGFWWFTGLADVQVIYAASIAKTRPYEYFVWANLAAVSFAVGPAVYAGVRRAVASPRALPAAAALLALAALTAIVVADLTGLSKAEVERIWLPFAVWLVVPCALLPRPRGWLADWRASLPTWRWNGEVAGRNSGSAAGAPGRPSPAWRDR